MNIVFCIDKYVIKSLKVIITSINHHTKRKISYYVICPKEDIKLFKKFVEKYKLDITIGGFEVTDKIIQLIKRCNYYNGSKIANYSRFFIKEVFPNLKKIIYLDTDMLVLDDIGKLWDSVEFNEDNFFAAPKYIWFHKLVYLKRLEYYYSYFNNNFFFNGGVYITDLTYWNDKLYKKLYQITFELIDNCITHTTLTLTEPILNCLFPNFIQLNPSWNCSGYGNKKLYLLLKLRDYNIKPKIIHWSGSLKPWHKLNVYMEKLWNYYFKETNNFIYVLYYDNNISNGKSKMMLNSLEKLSFNLIPINVHQYEKFLKLDPTIGINIKRHYCVKYFIQKNSKNSYYIFVDAYDVLFINFNYKIINYMEENNIKILYQNNTRGFRSMNSISNNVTNMYKADIFSSSYGINGGSFIGRGINILDFYNNFFKNLKKNDYSDEILIIRNEELYKHVTIDDSMFFINTDGIKANLKSFNQKITDLKIIKNLRKDIILFHFPRQSGRELLKTVKPYLLDNNKLEDLKTTKFRFLLFKFYFFILPIIISILKLLIILANFILSLFNI